MSENSRGDYGPHDTGQGASVEAVRQLRAQIKALEERVKKLEEHPKSFPRHSGVCIECNMRDTLNEKGICGDCECPK